MKVLGESSHKFLGDARITVGGGAVRSSKCFYLPKREASLMVMSESYAVQAKVYDRMMELEGTPATPIQLSRKCLELQVLNF
jgi:hypothetical protein